MKINLPVTNKEKNYSDDQVIVSTTDLKGIVTYANEDFCDIAGFSLDELEGKNHNVVRHPDMPKAAFADLWTTIKNDYHWYGVVKNRCKNGDHYWVDATVTAIFQDGVKTGYQSVRKKPKKETVDRAESVYQRINSGKPALPKAIPSVVKLWLLVFISTLPGLLIGHFFGLNTLVTAIIIGCVIAIPCFAFLKPINEACSRFSQIPENPLAQYIFTGKQDEFGRLLYVTKVQQSLNSTMLWRTYDSANAIAKVSKTNASMSQQSLNSIGRQVVELEQIATATEEMSATVQEVAQNTAETATIATAVETEVSEGKIVVYSTISNIKKLSEKINYTSTVVASLEQTSDSIGSVINTIKSIAEQTNLLALNAAIEAARAGEQGRGFAVVADEVRALAGSTQQATQDIQEMIDSLLENARNMSAAMSDSMDSVGECVTDAEKTESAFHKITESVNSITAMSIQIATAIEEQSSVTNEINRSISLLSSGLAETKELAEKNNQNSNELDRSVNALEQTVKQFTQDL